MSAEEGSSRCRESAGQKAPHEAAARFRMSSGNKCSTGTNRRRGSKAFKCSKLGSSAVNATFFFFFERFFLPPIMGEMLVEAALH